MMQWYALPLTHIKNQFVTEDYADKIYSNGTVVPYTGTNESFFNQDSSHYRTLMEEDTLSARLYTTTVF